MDHKESDPYRETHEILDEFMQKLRQLNSDLVAKRITQDQCDEGQRQLRRECGQKLGAALALADRRLRISRLH